MIKIGKKFSKDYQPERRRTPTIKLADILRKELDKPHKIKITGEDPITGKKVTVVINTPNKDILISVLLRKAAQGDMRAMDIVFDRHDGKLPTPIAMSGALELSAKSRQELSQLEDLEIEDAEFSDSE